MADSENEPANQPRSSSAARTAYFMPLRALSALLEILILFLVQREKTRYIQSVSEPNAHIHPQKNRPAKIVTGTIAAKGRRSGQMAVSENVPVTMPVNNSWTPEKAIIYSDGSQTKKRICATMR